MGLAGRGGGGLGRRSNSISRRQHHAGAVDGAEALLLDTYTGARGAWSPARKLRTAYSGSAIRVRESGSDTEADIGFGSDNLLDEAALLSHCGANSGYIVKLYDQSGNSLDATQSTASLQPQIVNAGTIRKVGGIPAIYADGTGSMGLGIASTVFSATTTLTVFNVQKYDATTNGKGFGFSNTFLSNRYIYAGVVVSGNFEYRTGTSSAITGTADTSLHVHTVIKSGTGSGQLEGFLDGSSQGTATDAAALSSNNQRIIGVAGSSTTTPTGYQGDVIVFTTAHASRAAIETALMSFWGIS